MKRETLEALVGKKVMFSGTEHKQGVFYYDATIKKIGEYYFLKYNKPNYDIFDNDIHMDNQKKEDKKKKTKLTVKDIMKSIDESLSDSYKCSYEVSLFDHDSDNRYSRIVELNKKNIMNEMRGS